MGSVKVRISLGNEAMQTACNVAQALRDTAGKIEEGNTIGIVVDQNGNVVGNYKITGKLTPFRGR